MFSRRLQGALMLGATILTVAPAMAFDDAQTRDIESIVRNYLIAHPEVLLESLQSLEAKRAAEAQAGIKESIVGARAELEGSPEGTVVGNANGDVTVVEFFDYNCGYCRRAASDMQALLESDPKLRVVLKEIPVLGPASEGASKVSLAFRSVAPEKYGAFQKALLASRGQADQTRALEVASEFGVAADQLLPLLEGNDVQSALAETARLGALLGINGTPSYVIGDELVPGAVGADALAAKIANVRSCGSATCAPG